jgi:hypothetical protein
MRPSGAVTRAALALAVTIALFVPADAAKAGFRINHSMEGITPGMSQADVRERLGRPARRERGPDFLNWHYRRPALELTFKPRVITLFTRSPFIRGPGDTGVGTHERRLRRVVPRLRCDTAEGQRRCVVGGFETGQRSTVFVIRRRQVTSITIAISAP